MANQSAWRNTSESDAAEWSVGEEFAPALLQFLQDLGMGFVMILFFADILAQVVELTAWFAGFGAQFFRLRIAAEASWLSMAG